MPEGYLVTIHIDGSITTQDAGPLNGRLALMQAAVGGDCEVIPGLDLLTATPEVIDALPADARAWFVDGKVQHCIGFCDEEGKVKGRPYNETGSQLWAYALAHAGAIRVDPDGHAWMSDVLVGPICLLIGERAIRSEQE